MGAVTRDQGTVTGGVGSAAGTGAQQVPASWGSLRRWPDIESAELRAWDATDQLLLEHGLAQVAAEGLTGDRILILGDRYGALTLGLIEAGVRRVVTVQDSVALVTALKANAEDLGLDGFSAFTSLDEVAEASATPDGGFRLVLWQLPRSVAEVEYWAAALCGLLADGTTVWAGGRDKHMTPAMNKPLERWLGEVQPQRGHKKSRVLKVLVDARQQDADAIRKVLSPEPRTVVVAGSKVTIHGDARVFGQNRIDPGTAFMLEAISDHDIDPEPGQEVVDLGCGNGTIAVWAARRWPDSHVEATDDSAAAVAATIASARASGVADQVRAVAADAGEHLLPADDERHADTRRPDKPYSPRLVLVNPPFHQGAVVERAIGEKLLFAAREIAGRGGRIIAVWNSHLRYRAFLRENIGQTRQLDRDATFTVTETRV